MEEIEKLISEQIIGRIGCHADDVTYVVPISYAYDGQFLYARTFEGKKLRMLRKNPRICFQVDDTLDLSNWKSVICWGIFEELTDRNDRNQAITILQDRRIPLISSQTMQLAQDFPFTTKDEDIKGIFFRIRIEEKTGMSEVNTDQSYYAT